MKQKILTVQILTPEGPLFEGTAQAAFLPGTVSPFEVLPGHAAIISALSAGEIRIVPADAAQESCLAIRGGVVKVRDNVITACVEKA